MLAQLIAVGVASAAATPGLGSGIHVGWVGAGSWADSSTVVELVEALAGQPDNINKLKRADADERHLFALVDHSHPEAMEAMELAIPDRAPKVADVINTVSVARRTGREANFPADRLCRSYPPGPWRSFDLPS